MPITSANWYTASSGGWTTSIPYIAEPTWTQSNNNSNQGNGQGSGGTGGNTGGGVNTSAQVLASMQNPHDHQWPGIPGFAWEFGPVDSNGTPPVVSSTRCSAGLPWFQITYVTNPPSTDTATRVQIRMLEGYLYSSSLAKWVKGFQATSSSLWNGYQYPNDFGSGTVPLTNVRDESANGGGISFLLSKTQTTGSVGQGTINCCIHGYPNQRIDLTALGLPSLTDIIACFTTAQVRLIPQNSGGTIEPQANYEAGVGWDWWLNTSIGFNPNQNNNPGAGQGQEKSIPINGNWQALNFWTGPVGFFPTWTGNQGQFTSGISLNTMSGNLPPLNALGT